MNKQIFPLLFCLLLLAACTAPTPHPTASPFPTSTQTTTPPPPVEIIITATPEPTATALPRTLTICMGAEPDTLYKYGGSMLASANVLEAIYDGPIDTNGYSFQPIILEKIPSLADGDAVIQPVTVSAGDTVLDADGNPVPLAAGVVFRPSGCRADDCEQTYAGGEVEMDQLSARFTLLEGLNWSDGEPLTAQDSVYSFELAGDPETPVSTFDIERTASYTALDEQTVQWVGVPGFLDATYQTNFWHPLPEHIYSEYSAAELLEDDISARTPLGW
ncbi:MAG TPA: ABC transporter substrate-binding protein, partial [Anaerolineales bacterium]|nr:ABC transporter substrate-binding protein [Anaerolineales bacterium]